MSDPIGTYRRVNPSQPPLTPDRVFVKAITTIRALSSRSSYGALPRPPAENRIKLYGLYKQATEGNVVGIMARPLGHTLEDEGAKKKWDAWKREEGLTRTEAKRQYIQYLIETMRVYASGTSEARELLGELEYLWDQIKDVEFSDEDEHAARRFQSPLVAQGLPYDPVNRFVSKLPGLSQVDQSDRLSTGTPWPIGSTYLALVSNQQYRNNLEQIYSHSTRNTQLLLSEYVQQQRNKAQSVYLVPGRRGAANASVGGAGRLEGGKVPESTLEDFRNWQGEINTIVNKLSKEFLDRKLTGRKSAYSLSELEPELELDPKEVLKKRVLRALKLVGFQALHFLKNFTISIVALLFLVWCIKRNVKVELTVVKQQIDSTRRKKELVVNMIVNTDENKWFVRLLTFINSFVGFV